jgi:hypothetical protein
MQNMEQQVRLQLSRPLLSSCSTALLNNGESLQLLARYTGGLTLCVSADLLLSGKPVLVCSVSGPSVPSQPLNLLAWSLHSGYAHLFGLQLLESVVYHPVGNSVAVRASLALGTPLRRRCSNHTIRHQQSVL